MRIIIIIFVVLCCLIGIRVCSENERYIQCKAAMADATKEIAEISKACTY